MIHSWGKGGESLGICGSSNNLSRWFALFHPSGPVLHPSKRFASKDCNPFMGHKICLAFAALPITADALQLREGFCIKHPATGATAFRAVHVFQMTSSLMWDSDLLVLVCKAMIFLMTSTESSRQMILLPASMTLPIKLSLSPRATP